MSKRRKKRTGKKGKTPGKIVGLEETKPIKGKGTLTREKIDFKKISVVLGGAIALIANILAIIADTSTILRIFQPMEPASSYIDKPLTVHIIIVPSSNEIPKELTYSNVLYEQGLQFFQQGNYEQATVQYKQAMDESGKNVDMDMARIQYAIGLAYRYLEQLDDAEEFYTKAIGTLESLMKFKQGSGDTQLTDMDELIYEKGYVYYLRSITYLDRKDLEKAEMDCRKCMECLEKVNDEIIQRGNYSFAAAKNLEGQILLSYYWLSQSQFAEEEYLGMEKYTLEDALAAFNEALEYKGAVLEDQNLSETEDAYVVTPYLTTEYAVFSWDDEVQLEIPIASDLVYFLYNKDIETAEILTNRSKVLSELGDFDGVIKDCETALKIYEDIPENEKRNIFQTYWQLGIAKIITKNNLGEPLDKDALWEFKEMMEKGLKYSQKWLGGSTKEALAYENLGMANLLLNDYEKATECYQEAEEIYLNLDREKGLDKDKDIQFVRKMLETIENHRESGGSWVLN